jgi:hypothetical protein
MIGPDGQPQGPCLPLDARIAVLEENLRESKADRRRTNESLERIDHTLIAVVAGTTAILERMTEGADRMEKHEVRLDALEADKLRRDTEFRAAKRHVAVLVSVGTALGGAASFAFSHFHAWFAK